VSDWAFMAGVARNSPLGYHSVD